MVVKSVVFRMRCTPYERALITAIRDASEVNGITVLTETDVVKSAIAKFAGQYVPAEKLAALKLEYESDQSQ